VPWLTQYLQFLQEYRFIVFGPILVLLVIFLPHGVVGTYMGLRARRAAQEAPPAGAPAPRSAAEQAQATEAGRA
jgi:branched-chain amino acid transport system permease protein